MLPQDPGEGVLRGVGRRPVVGAGQAGASGIVAEQVDMKPAAAQGGGQLSRLFRGVVDSRQETVLHDGRMPGASLEPVHGGQDLGDAVPLREGQDAGAGGVVGGVERHGKLDPRFGGGQGVDAGDDAHRGDGDLVLAQASQPVVGDAPHRGEDRGQIEQGFAHAHEHEGAEAASGPAGLRLEGEELPNDFALGEIAAETGPGRGAEIAAHGAPDLGGHAAGGAVGPVVGHQHRLDRALVVQLEEAFHRAVGGVLSGSQGHRRGGEGFLKACVEAAGEAGGGVLGSLASAVQVPQDPLGVQRGKAPRAEVVGELFRFEIGEGDGHSGRRVRGRRDGAKRELADPVSAGAIVATASPRWGKRHTMVTALLIFLGSGLGGLARWGAGEWVTARWGAGFPWGTLLVNVTGSFAIGLFGAVTGPGGRWAVGVPGRLFLMVGVCGGYTTFSSFSIQTLQLAEKGEWLAAGLNVGMSVVFCLAGVWMGHAVGLLLNGGAGRSG